MTKFASPDERLVTIMQTSTSESNEKGSDVTMAGTTAVIIYEKFLGRGTSGDIGK